MRQKVEKNQWRFRNTFATANHTFSGYLELVSHVLLSVSLHSCAGRRWGGALALYACGCVHTRKQIAITVHNPPSQQILGINLGNHRLRWLVVLTSAHSLDHPQLHASSYQHDY